MNEAMILLAGGRATRLGPLGHVNKAMVSVGQRPVVAWHIKTAIERQVRHLYIVCPPRSEALKQTVSQVTNGLPLGVSFVEQPEPRGPADALRIGTEAAIRDGQVRGLYVLMADTLVDDGESSYDDLSYVVTAYSDDNERSWCFVNDNEFFVEGKANGHPVCVGAYWFVDPGAVLAASALACATTHLHDEVPMSRFLNNMEPYLELRVTESWIDVGDIVALEKARRTNFVGRDFNTVKLSDDGIVYKTPMDDAQGKALFQWNDESNPLFPRFFPPNGTEYCDVATLAETYLYSWLPDRAWAMIGERVIGALDQALWKDVPSPGDTYITKWSREMYVDKMFERFDAWDHKVKEQEYLVVQGDDLAAGRELLERLGTFLEEKVVSTASENWSVIHGDPNWTNVLCSLGTGTVKLLDPRGKWGTKETRQGDKRYDIAKLRYSYADHFALVCHDLFVVEQHGNVLSLRPGVGHHLTFPTEFEIVLMRNQDLRVVNAIQASILLSAMPLHPPKQALALYAMGLKRAAEVVGT